MLFSTGHLYRSLLEVANVEYCPYNPLEKVLEGVSERELEALFDGHYEWYEQDLRNLSEWDVSPVTHKLIVRVKNYLEHGLSEEVLTRHIKHSLLDSLTEEWKEGKPAY